MRLPDELMRCVFFVGTHDDAGVPQWRGTGFFMSVPLEDEPETSILYVVTARHNIEGARGENRPLLIRFNLADGRSRTAILQVTWTVDEADLGSDVAVATIGIDTELLDFANVPRRMLVTDELITTENIGIGDDLGVVGLFTKRAGSERNQPILRTGTIAAMPSEPLINRRTGAPFVGYRMELRSIAGLSGSPVFVVMPVGRFNAGELNASIKVHLLGVLHGHWGIRRGEYLEMDVQTEAVGAEEPLNTGIGVVAPAQQILRLLDREDQLEKRRSLMLHKSAGATEVATE